MREINKTKAQLEYKLNSSAFRYGSSAFRLGLIPVGISDHLPIEVRIPQTTQSPLKMVSWNLLADGHLYNNFMNISGTRNTESIAKTLIDGNLAQTYISRSRNQLYHFFSELAQYLFNATESDEIKVTPTLLDGFVAQAHESLLARSRSPEKVAQKVKQATQARSEMIALFKDHTHPLAHEFKLAIRHSLELIYHIKSNKGALRWENRLLELKANKQLIDTLISCDFIALQECTNPKDLAAIVNAKAQKFKQLIHTAPRTPTDHCVLFYDDSKFSLVGAPLTGELGRGKPCLFAKFINKQTGEYSVIGSVHHPGGEDERLDEMLVQAQSLMEESAPCDLFILGDYNHEKHHFIKILARHSELSMHYPPIGTMAGSDYGHCNRAIDALLTNHASKDIVVDRVSSIALARPAKTPTRVNFDAISGQVKRLAQPRLLQHAVQNCSAEASKATQSAFPLSRSLYATRTSL